MNVNGMPGGVHINAGGFCTRYAKLQFKMVVSKYVAENH